jgi:hypothetical protein
VAAARLAAQLLTGRAADRVEGVVGRLLAVQAQELRGARLAVRARSNGLLAADVDAALGAGRLVVTWLNRGTLHLVRAEDYWWLHPVTTPQLATGSARRLRQEGVDPRQAARGIEVVTEAVTTDGPQTRACLRERLDAAGVPTRGQALVHVLLAASIAGLVVRGPVVGAEQCYVAVADWLGEPPPTMDREAALARLATRYLAGHEPADAADLANWAGIPLRDARRGLAAAARLGEVRGGDDAQFRVTAESVPDTAENLPDTAERPPDTADVDRPRLLGPFDPLLLGWRSREPVVGPHRSVVTVNGIFRAVALVGGRVTATWGLSAGVVTLRPLEPIGESALAALDREAANVLRFLGLPLRPLVVAPG